MKAVVLENIRSAYNVGNIIRTADALGWQVWLVGYTPSPKDTPKVIKTSLGAEKSVKIKRFDDGQEFVAYCKSKNITIYGAEITENSVSLDKFEKDLDNFCIVFGNEVRGVSEDTLVSCENIIHIPMNGIKESMNIGQTTAIFMWELGK